MCAIKVSLYLLEPPLGEQEQQLLQFCGVEIEASLRIETVMLKSEVSLKVQKQALVVWFFSSCLLLGQTSFICGLKPNSTMAQQSVNVSTTQGTFSRYTYEDTKVRWKGGGMKNIYFRVIA